MAWRAAKSIVQLQRDLDRAHPGRKKPDGIIGDAAHASRESDHNPNAAGVVQAIDISEGGGLADRALADRLLASHDKRIKYIISEGRIGSSYKSGGAMPWTWRPYTGSNAHMSHVHVSVVDDPALYDDESPWNITGDLIPTPLPTPPVDDEIRRLMAKKIINYEWRSRPFKVHTTSDGPEIVGIVQSKHPEWYQKVVAHLGNDAALENAAAEFYITYTNQAMTWTDDLGVEHAFRNLLGNRGTKGGPLIIQDALGFAGDDRDGAIGPKSKAAIAQVPPLEMIERIRKANEQYDSATYGYGPGHAYYNGLVRRWNEAQADAKAFHAMEVPEPKPVEPPVVVEPPKPIEPPPVVVVPPVVVPPIIPTPVPPQPPGTIDFGRLERLNSLDIELMVRGLEQAIASNMQVLQEIKTKMKLDTPAAIHEAVRSGKTAAEILEERNMPHQQPNTDLAANTNKVAVVDVQPVWQSKTFWSAMIAGAVPILHILTRGKLDIDPATQDWIATAVATVAGFAAAAFKATSKHVTPTGAENARNG